MTVIDEKYPEGMTLRDLIDYVQFCIDKELDERSPVMIYTPDGILPVKEVIGDSESINFYDWI